MRKFSSITNINLPHKLSSDKTEPGQTDKMPAAEIDECNPGQTGMNIQPNMKELKNINK